VAAALCAGAAVLAAVSALTPASPDPAPVTAGSASVPLPPGAGAGPVAAAARVAVTVRLADVAGTLLLHPGVHVEVIGGAPAGSAGTTTGGLSDAAVLAEDAVVLGVPQPGSEVADDGGLLGGGPAGGDSGLAGVVVLSVGPYDAHRLAAAAGTRPLSVTVALPPP
jgi:hypothetical protein